MGWEENPYRKRKSFLERKFKKALEVIQRSGEVYSTDYLEGAYAARRYQAILACLGKTEKKLKDLSFDVTSLVDAYTQMEVLTYSNYNSLNRDYDLSIGAAIWILDRLQTRGILSDLYPLLPDPDDSGEGWLLPTDFFHPCYSNGLIEAVIRLLEGEEGEIVTRERTLGKRKDKAYTDLLSMLPPEDVEKACQTFRERQDDLIARYLKGISFHERQLAGSYVSMRSVTEPFALRPAVKPGSGEMAHTETMKKLEAFRDFPNQLMDWHEKTAFYTQNFVSLLRMDPNKARRELGSRELAETVKDFCVEDPYELCFALFCLIGKNDHAPWLMCPGTYLMSYVRKMLPWYVDQSDWDDDDLDEWYDGLDYFHNDWLNQGLVKDPVDYLHTMHGGQNLAQIIYGLCRGVVPMGLHPFEDDRKELVAAGMEEHTARLLTAQAEMLFFQSFQTDSEFWDYTLRDVLPGRLEPAFPHPEDEEADGDGGGTESPKGIPLFDCARVPGKDAADTAPAAEESPDENAFGAEEEMERLREELIASKKQIKALLSTLAQTRQEAQTERARMERELKSLRMEHRELSDLRELVFNRETESQIRREKEEKKTVYPYETKKRTVIFGGHDSFLKVIRPMLPGVKFVDVSNFSFNPDIVKNADVVWIQNNCLSHPQYWNIVRYCKASGVQMRYFAYASAEKCADQLAEWDQK